MFRRTLNRLCAMPLTPLDFQEIAQCIDVVRRGDVVQSVPFDPASLPALDALRDHLAAVVAGRATLAPRMDGVEALRKAAATLAFDDYSPANRRLGDSVLSTVSVLETAAVRADA